MGNHHAYSTMNIILHPFSKCCPREVTGRVVKSYVSFLAGLSSPRNNDQCATYPTSLHNTLPTQHIPRAFLTEKPVYIFKIGSPGRWLTICHVSPCCQKQLILVPCSTKEFWQTMWYVQAPLWSYTMLYPQMHQTTAKQHVVSCYVTNHNAQSCPWQRSLSVSRSSSLSFLLAHCSLTDSNAFYMNNCQVYFYNWWLSCLFLSNYTPAIVTGHKFCGVNIGVGNCLVPSGNKPRNPQIFVAPDLRPYIISFGHSELI